MTCVYCLCANSQVTGADDIEKVEHFHPRKANVEKHTYSLDMTLYKKMRIVFMSVDDIDVHD